MSVCLSVRLSVMLHAAWLVCLSVSVVDKLHHIPGDLHLHSAGSWGVVMLSVCVSVPSVLRRC